jgi:hypothetical protein
MFPASTEFSRDLLGLVWSGLAAGYQTVTSRSALRSQGGPQPKPGLNEESQQWTDTIE